MHMPCTCHAHAQVGLDAAVGARRQSGGGGSESEHEAAPRGSVGVVEYASDMLARLLEPSLAARAEDFADDACLADAIAFAINAKQASDLPRGFAALCGCEPEWTIHTLHEVAEFGLKNRITDAADAPGAGGALALLLRTFNRIVGIDLSWVRIGSGGCAVLADALGCSRSLEWLKLDTTQSGDRGARALAAALRTNRSLAYLDLWGAEITSAGAAALAAALQQPGGNGTLHELQLRANWIDDAAVPSLVQVVRTNSTLRSLGLLEVSFSDTGVKQLQQAAAQRQQQPKLQLAVSNSSYSWSAEPEDQDAAAAE